MRRLFFERELEDLNLQVMADPAERQVLPALDVTFEVLAFMPRRSAP